MKINRLNICLICVLLILLLATNNTFKLKKPATSLAATVNNQKPQMTLLDWNVLLKLKEKIKNNDPHLTPAYTYLLKRANSILAESPVSVMQKSQLPPSGDKHDYMSLAPYAWPDLKHPSGKYIAKDGQVNPERDSISDFANLQKMITSVKYLSLAYFYSGNEQYAKQASLYLRTWFISPQSKMNPNLTYSQIVKGSNNLNVGVIDTANMEQVLDSVSLLASSSSFSHQDMTELKKWFGQYLDWLLYSPQGQREAQLTNNRGTWYDAQTAATALFIGKREIAHAILEQSKVKRLSHQIKPDGSQPEELKRTRSWDYSNYNLQALFTLASVARQSNIDLWNYTGSQGQGLQKALDYLTPYAEGAKWNHTQILEFKPSSLAIVLRQAAAVYNRKDYWNLAENIDSNSKASIDNLLYLSPLLQ